MGLGWANVQVAMACALQRLGTDIVDAMSITTQANPPKPYDWASKSIDEMLADVQALVEQVSSGPCACCADTILIPAGPLHDTLTFALAAERRLRRTRGGQWAIDGRRYRTKALALESAQARIMEPLWPALLTRGRRFVLTGEIERVEIEGVIAT